MYFKNYKLTKVTLQNKSISFIFKNLIYEANYGKYIVHFV